MILRRTLLIASLLATALPVSAETFRLHSPTINDQGTLPVDHVLNGFGCKGKNVSPELIWSGAPKDAKSFAIMLYDPDAPTGSGWWHWVVVNIPASATRVSAGAGNPDGKGLPDGAQQFNTDFGTPGFGGACPPKGDNAHRYVVTIYALKVPKLELPDNATAALAGFMINANKIAKASMTAYYGR